MVRANKLKRDTVIFKEERGHSLHHESHACLYILNVWAQQISP